MQSVVSVSAERTRSTLSLIRRPLADVNSANVAAGLTAGIWYAFGGIPLFLDAAARLGLSAAATSSWFFAIFFTSAAASLVLALSFRQPFAIGWTLPGLVYLVTMGGTFTLAEMAGAGLVAGAITLALGWLGMGERLVRWVPLPIIMGVFAGSVFAYITSMFGHLAAQPWTVGAALLGYLGGRAIQRPWLPPVGGALIAGLTAAALGGQLGGGQLHWAPPVLAPIWPSISLSVVLALSLPLVLIMLGLGSVQGIGVLASQGYRPPANLLTAVMGITTMINALFGGHPSSIQRNGVAILGGQDAGPREQRYVACVIASLIALVLALFANSTGVLLDVLPLGLIATLGGLAILSTLMDALKSTTTSDLPAGAFFALAIAASPFTFLGIGAAFWALVGGLLVSLALERPALVRAWGLGGTRE